MLFLIILRVFGQELTLLSPIFRNSLSPNQCTVDQEIQSHLLTSLSSIEPLAWEVTQPDPFSNCSLLLFSESDLSKYVELYTYPKNQYKFPCARQIGIEQLSFKMPGKFLCSYCTIQLTVEGKTLKRYACADIQVFAGKSECKCKNKGVCVNEICKCADGFSGEHCERSNNDEDAQGAVFKFLLGSLMVFVLIITIYLYMHPEKLPKNVVTFLDNNAKWMLRNPGVNNR